MNNYSEPSVGQRPRRPGRPPGSSDARARRERLVEAAIQLIGNRGLAAASTRAVAEAAGLTQAMVHYSFPSKQAMLDAVLDAVHARTGAALQSGIAGAPDLDSALRALAQVYWDHVRADPALQKAQYELTLAALNRGEEKSLARRQYAGYVALLGEALARVDGKAADDPQLQRLAGTAVALMDGLILQLLAGEDEAAVKARLDTGLLMMLGMLQGERDG